MTPFVLTSGSMNPIQADTANRRLQDSLKSMNTLDITDPLPELIVRRWTQALRVNNAADWRQMAELCGRYAMSFFVENDYDPEHKHFKAMCRLARTAHVKRIECLVKTFRDHGTYA